VLDDNPLGFERSTGGQVQLHGQSADVHHRYMMALP
jgi:hypothetical protein